MEMLHNVPQITNVVDQLAGTRVVHEDDMQIIYMQLVHKAQIVKAKSSKACQDVCKGLLNRTCTYKSLKIP